MSYTLTQTWSGQKQAAANSTQFTLLAGGALTMIESATATYITNECEPGDGAVVSGSTSNDGTHLITQVVSETIVIVKLAGTTEAGAGTVRIDAAGHTLLIQDEATTSWAAIETAVAEPCIVSRKRTSASETGVGPTATTGVKYWVVRSTISLIRIHNPGAGIETVWTSLREAVYRVGHSSLLTSQGGWRIQHAAADDGSLVLQLGELSTASDKDSIQNGSIFLGLNTNYAPNEVTTKIYGSFVSSVGTTNAVVFVPGATGKGPGQVFGTLVEGPISVPSGGGTDGVEFSAVVNVSSGAGIVPQALIDISSFLQAQAVTVGALIFVTGAVLASFRKSGDAITPPVSLIFSTATFLDPQEDYPFDDLVAVANTATGKKAYTWTPTFMTINDKQGVGQGTIEPVSGVYVEAEYIEITRIVDLGSSSPGADGTYTVTINGTDFDEVSVSQSHAVIVANLVTTINAGAEPVTATQVKNGTDFSIEIIPDDFHVAFTIAVSSTGDPLTLQGNTAAVTGFPATTDANGQIGSKEIEVASKVTSVVDSQGLIHKMLRYRISHEAYEPFERQIYLTKKTTETVYVELPLYDLESEGAPSI